MLIIVPLAFVGAALYNGKNPLAAFKEMIGKEPVAEDGLIDTAPAETDQPAGQGREAANDPAVLKLQTRIGELEQELEKCREAAGKKPGGR